MECSPTSTSSIIKPLVLLLLLSLNVIVNADSLASSYFSNVSTDEKEVYTNWVATHSSPYPRHTFMPSFSSNDDKDGAAIFWNINNDDESIDFAIAVRSEGWVGFGLSEAGGMMGSDMALYSASNPDDIIDAYVVDDRSTPLEDDCQDWTLKETTVADGWMIVEFSRLIDTQDNQDHSIKNDVDLWTPATRIIAAWGDSDDVSYHGQKKSRGSVRLFATHSNELSEMEAQIETLEEQSDGHFDFTEDNFTIPAVDTHYEDVCKEFDMLNLNLPEGQSMVTMIGVVPLIEDESAQFVHHFIVSLQKDCTEESALTKTMVYAWAPGDEGWALPDDVGFPMFDNINNQAIHLEIHYDNPSLIEGRKDSSGLRFYYSNRERTHRAGILQVGDPFLSLYGQDIKDGLTQYKFTCPGECSSSILAKERSGDNQAVTVFSEFLHMHQSGIHMKNEVIRREEVIHTATSEVYDFEQQGAYHHPQDSYEVRPGDSFRVTCSYKDGTAFGLSSSEEMCISFFYYYPAKTLMGDIPWTCPFQPFWTEFGVDTTLTCATELEHTELNDINELGRSFGESSSNQCTADDTTTSGNDVDEPTTSDPQEGPGIIVVDPDDMEDEDSSAGWFGVSFLFPTLSALIVACLM